MKAPEEEATKAKVVQDVTIHQVASKEGKHMPTPTTYFADPIRPHPFALRIPFFLSHKSIYLNLPFNQRKTQI